jgi:hypothetical protein
MCDQFSLPSLPRAGGIILGAKSQPLGGTLAYTKVSANAFPRLAKMGIILMCQVYLKASQRLEIQTVIFIVSSCKAFSVDCNRSSRKHKAGWDPTRLI